MCKHVLPKCRHVCILLCVYTFKYIIYECVDVNMYVNVYVFTNSMYAPIATTSSIFKYVILYIIYEYIFANMYVNMYLFINSMYAPIATMSSTILPWHQGRSGGGRVGGASPPLLSQS